jgi:hypothetical protein
MTRSRVDAVIALYQAGRLSEAASLALTELAQDAGNVTLWYVAALSFARLGDFGIVLDIVAQANRLAQPAPLFLNRVCHWLLDDRHFPTLRAFLAAIPNDHVGQIIVLYYTGCTYLVTGEHGQALALFSRFRQRVPAFLPAVPFLTDERLNVVLRQGRLVATPAEIAAMLETASEPAVTDLCFHTSRIPAGTGEAAGPIYACSADPKYLELFAAPFVEALAGHHRPTRLHLSLVNGDAALVARMVALCAGFPHLTADVSTVRTRHQSSTLYACARFLTLPALLARYRAPVITLDIDVSLGERWRAFEPMVQAPATPFDLACFRTNRNEPGSIYNARMIAWQPTAATGDFLAVFAAFCGRSADEVPAVNWMLDQAALFSIRHYFRETGRPLAFKTLNELTGLTLEDASHNLRPDLGEKSALRGGRLQFSLDPGAV